MERKWDIQLGENPWFSLGFHFDHTDPSLTLHLPFFIICFGRVKQPGFRKEKKNYKYLKPPWTKVPPTSKIPLKIHIQQNNLFKDASEHRINKGYKKGAI